MFPPVFSPLVDVHCVQGEEISKSHKVQSERAVAEQTICDLKTAKVMSGNKINTVVEKSKELDCVIGLHNLRILLKEDPAFDIPERRGALLEEHIFKPLVAPADVDLKIPPPIVPKQERNIRHIRKFEEFLRSAAPAIARALETGGNESVFYPTVGKRGRNLSNGAYVLQLRVQEEDLDVWIVKFVVGASYSYQTHTGYFKLSKLQVPIDSICCCYSGCVVWCFFIVDFDVRCLIRLSFFFFSARARAPI